MDASSTRTRAVSARALARVGGLIAAGVGALALVLVLGWQLGITRLTDVVAGYASMKANTALAFVLSGAGLIGLTSTRPFWQRAGQVVAGAAALLGALTLLEYLTGRDFGIDQILIADLASTPFPGRMVPATAANFMAIGIAIVSIRWPTMWPSQLWAGLVAVVAFISLVGYVYDASSLYVFGPYGSLAAHTALTFEALAIGVIAARPHDGLTWLLSESTPGSHLARRFLPAAIFLPAIVGWLSVFGQRAGWYDTAFGVALFAVTLTVTFLGLTILIATWIDRANERQRHAERDLAAIVDASYDAIISMSLHGDIRSWNRGAERLYGYTAAEAIGQSVGLIVPQDRQDDLAGILAAIVAGESVSQEALRLTKTGHLVDVSSTVSPLRSPSGDVVGISSVSRDVTGQRQIEERFRLAVEASPSGMILVDATTRIVLVNGEVERMFGYTRQELTGELVEQLLHDDSPGRGHRKDGSEFPAEIKLNRLETREGPLTLCVIVDVSERQAMLQRLEAQTAELQRSNDELTQFAYVASHDLREPLRMVTSYTELLAARYREKLDERAVKYLHHIMDGSTRMQQLIRDLLNYAKVGTRSMQMVPVDLNLVVQRVTRDLRAYIDDARAEVIIHTLPTVLSEEVQSGQLFQNLIGNAIKFRGQRPPRVLVTATREGADWRISVTDNGIGIDMKFRERVFEIFQRLHERGTYEGTGVGLAVVKRIVERHGGRIWFESILGEGTRFSFTLPADPAS
jgi:PAS domain S-box-containing protein